MMALATTGLVGGSPAAAYLGAAASEGVAASLPFLFAGASGALAVASALAAWSIWRRARALERRAERLERMERDNLSTELVFTAAPGRLTPASPATFRFLSQALDRDEEACALDRAGLDALIGAESAARLHPLIGDLVRRGEEFRLEGADAQGGIWSFIGETVGARAVLRLVPLGRATAATRAEAARPAATSAVSDSVESAEKADLQAMLAAAPSGMAAFDKNRRLILANLHARQLLRLASDWVSARPTLRAFLDQLYRRQRMPEQPNYPAWRERALAKPAETLGADALWALPNGDALRVAARETPTGGFALFVSDETAELSLERRFKSAMGARRATIAAVEQGLALVGGDGAVQLLNPAFARIWGLDARFGADCAERFMEDGAGGRVALSEIAAAATGGGDAESRALWDRIEAAVTRQTPPRRSDSFEAVRTLRRGEAPQLQTLAIRVTPLPDGASLIACVDVSDARAIERALRDKAEALEAADRLKTDFLTDMAYQLRTPLNAVIGFADMLNQDLAGPLDARQQEYVGYVLSAANDLRELVGDALDLGALRAGSLALRRAPFDLAAAAATVAAMAAKRAERRGAIFVATIEDAALPVEGDERRLRHALFGSIATALNEAETGDEARLTVRLAPQEAGSAPAAEVVVALARRKTRKALLADAERRSLDGGGVSLTLARRIVEAHGGTTELEEAALGLRARFLLPLRQDDEAQPFKAADGAAQALGAGAGGGAG